MVAGASEYLALQKTVMGGSERGLRDWNSAVLQPIDSVTLDTLSETFPRPRASKSLLARP